VVPLADDLAEPHLETGLLFDFTDSGVWRLLSGLDFPGDETPWGLTVPAGRDQHASPGGDDRGDDGLPRLSCASAVCLVQHLPHLGQHLPRHQAPPRLETAWLKLISVSDPGVALPSKARFQSTSAAYLTSAGLTPRRRAACSSASVGNSTALISAELRVLSPWSVPHRRISLKDGFRRFRSAS
jgi:hypothetical protein